MNDLLMGIVVDVMAFLELSGDDVVDPKSAMTWLESISYKLQKLEPGDREAFLAFVAKRAQDEEEEQMKEFLRSLPEASGLIEE
jgi:hypothetical protein